MASHRRGPWSQGEDAYLVQLVHTQGALNWVRIAQLIGSRSPKQCRERYHQNLKPSLNHEPISPEEGLQIERLVAEMGKRWAEIARRLHGRSDNAVKNWWNGSMNRRRRLVVRRGMPSRCSREFDENHEQLSFARPAEPSRRPLSINAYSDSRRSSEIPLPSPSVSEVSRADSMEGAPSLVSDTGSSFSISPRVAPPATIELPPLTATRHAYRRPSLPVFQFGSGAFVSDADTQAQVFSARFHPDQKTPGPSPLQRYEFPMDDRSPHSLPRGHFHAVNGPRSPARLPSLSTPDTSGDHRTERDNRMKMSSLLG